MVGTYLQTMHLRLNGNPKVACQELDVQQMKSTYVLNLIALCRLFDQVLLRNPFRGLVFDKTL